MSPQLLIPASTVLTTHMSGLRAWPTLVYGEMDSQLMNTESYLGGEQNKV